MSANLYLRVRFRLNGDRAILVDCGEGIDPAVNEKVLTLTSLLKQNPPAGVEAVIPAYRCFAVVYNPLLTEPKTLEKAIRALEDRPSEAARADAKVVWIPVCYGGDFGPDITAVCAHTGLNEDDIIAIHSFGTYPIYMIGFTPGFCYLGGMDKRLQTPRRETPRTVIPAGSVGIAEAQTGIYPIESPGGWQIIGRTPLRLFAPEKTEPFLYRAGDSIRFKPISPEEFRRLQEKEPF